MKNILAIFLAFFIVAFANAKNNHAVVLDSLPSDLTENNTNFQALLEKAKAGDAASMYHLGRCYLLGSYVKKDVEQGFQWTTKSANAGYPSAWTELGRYYKYGTGRPVDFTKAYAMFSKGAELKDRIGMYFKGYMQYKGFGCKQDYAAAIVDFNQSAALNNSASMYMLGLCYRNGFGTEPDLEKARINFKKATDLRFLAAFNELQSINGEYNLKDSKMLENSAAAKVMSAKAGFDVNNYTTVNSNVKTAQLNGDFAGYLLKYDFSGTKIIEATPITLSLEAKDTVIMGIWTENGSTKPLTFTAAWRNNKMVFKNTTLRRADHYHEYNALRYSFENADIQFSSKIDGNYLRANVNIYAPSLKEPYYPVTLVLSNKITTIISKVAQNNNAPISNPDMDKIAIETINGDDLNAYPNPFDNEINVTFSLEAAADVTLKISAADAKVLYRSEQKNLQSGAHFFSVPLAVPSGEYLVSLEIGNKIKTFKIIKP